MQGIYLSAEELDALYGLPLLARELYICGIRPQMDLRTGKVGVRSSVSWLGLASLVRVERAPGIKEMLPSRSQLRRAAEHLVRRGLVVMESEGLQLVFACLKARLPESAQNKVINKPTSKGGNDSNVADSPESLAVTGLERDVVGEAHSEPGKEKNENPTHLRVSEIKNSLSGAADQNFQMYRGWVVVDVDRVELMVASHGFSYEMLSEVDQEVMRESFINYWVGRPDKSYCQSQWEMRFVEEVVYHLRKRA